MRGVRVIKDPVERYESEDCLVWHIPSNQKTKVCHTLHNVCDNCKKVCLQIILYAHVNLSVHVIHVRCIVMSCDSAGRKICPN